MLYKLSLTTLFSFCLLVASLQASAQRNEYTLKGYMGVQGGESFHYDLKLKDSTGNLLSGYSSTYSNPENDVQTYVVAEIDRSAKTLHIKESTIIHNNYFKSNVIICLVESNLKYSSLEKNLFGKLITVTAGNGANCSNGSISFSDKNEIDNLFNPAAKTVAPVAAANTPKPVAVKPKRIIYDTLPATPRYTPPPAPKQPIQATITEGKDKTYDWTSNEIILEIWDGNSVDNDQVTVSYNGNDVLKDYTLTSNKKQLKLPIGGNELNIISIKAINEGAEPPNTANITIKDGNTNYDIMAYNTFGKIALIKIKKKM
jgi:hypothetical protein